MYKRFLSRTLVAVLLAGQMASGSFTKSNIVSAAEENPWKLTWSDEFDGPAIDTSKWGYELGHIRNNELQYYTNSPENAYIDNGSLVIETKQQEKEGYKYTSASLLTKDKFSTQFGRIEMRAKLPQGPAIWPAFWTMGTEDGWPKGGEIDIMELWGGGTGDGKVCGNAHWLEDGIHKDATSIVPNNYYRLPDGGKCSDDYHIYAIEWNSTKIKWYFDDINYYTMDITSPGQIDGFTDPHFIMLNTAVSPGANDTSNTYPQKYYIDYVRVYQNENESNGQIRNAGLEDGYKYWSGSGNSVPNDFYEGSKALEVAPGSSGEQLVTGLLPNTIYTLQAQVKSKEGAVARLGAKEVGDGGLTGDTQTTNGEYTQLTTTFVTGYSSTSAKIYLSNDSGSGMVYGDSFKLSAQPGISSPGILNGGFEEGFKYWSTWSLGHAVTHDAYSGNGSVEITKDTSHGGDACEQIIKGLLPNSTYTVSAMIKVADGEGITLGVKEFGGNIPAGQPDDTIGTYVTSKTYQKATLTFTTGATNTSAKVFLYAWDTQAYGDDFEITGPGIDQFKLNQQQLTTVPDSVLSVAINRVGPGISKSGQYQVTLPEGWQLQGDGKFESGNAVDTLSIKLPGNLSFPSYNIRIKAVSGSTVENDMIAQIKILDPITISNFIGAVTDTKVAKNWAVSTMIKNNSSTSAVSGTIAVVEPAELAGMITPVDFTNIAAGGSTTVKIPMPVMPMSDSTKMKFRITLTNGYTKDVLQDVHALIAVQSDVKPSIDGIIDGSTEWANTGKFYLNKLEQTAGSIPNWNLDNVSGTGYVNWDMDNVYVAVKVKDNVQYQPYADGNIWQGDSVQIAFDPERGTGVTNAGHYEYGFALSSDNVVQKWSWSAAYGRATGAATNTQCNITRDETNKVTTYEMAIPFTEILADGVQPSERNLLGFALVINDADGASTGRGYIQYCGGIADGKETGKNGSLVLLKLNHDATLTNIMVNGKALEGFAADKTSYDVVLPANDPKLPIVEAIKSDSNATVNVDQVSEHIGTANINVTAEDGITIKTYKVNFTKLQSAAISAESMTLSRKSTEQINITGKLLSGGDADLSDATIQYTSDDPKVASVDDKGVITANKEGCATITASVILRGTKVTSNPITITVTKKEKSNKSE